MNDNSMEYKHPADGWLYFRIQSPKVAKFAQSMSLLLMPASSAKGFYAAGQMMGIPLIDYLILSDKIKYSFIDSGKLDVRSLKMERV